MPALGLFTALLLSLPWSQSLVICDFVSCDFVFGLFERRSALVCNVLACMVRCISWTGQEAGFHSRGRLCKKQAASKYELKLPRSATLCNGRYET